MTFAKAPVALLCAAALLSAPAFAKPGEAQIKAEVKERNGVTVYCITEQVIDSKIPQKTCRTREEWKAAGATFKLTAKRKGDPSALASKE